jgi:hypothetical protein
MAQTIGDQHDDAHEASPPMRAPAETAVTAPVAPAAPAPAADDVTVTQNSTATSASPPPAGPKAEHHGVTSPRRNPLRPVRRGARRTRVVVRQVGPLSVLKFSLIFYFCVMLIVFFALLIIYGVLSAAGAMEEVGKLLGYFFGTGETGTRDPEPIAINGRVVFTWLFVGGLVFTVVWSVINVFVAFLYNLISDIVGGIDVTLAEKPPR